MNQDDVAGLHPRRKNIAVIAFIGTDIIGGEKADEFIGSQRPLMAVGIDMIDLPAAGRFGYGAGAHCDGFLRRAAIRIAHGEMDFIFGIGLKVQHTAGEAGRHSVIVVVGPKLRLGAGDEFAAHAEQRQSGRPPALPSLAIGHGHGGIAIVVAADLPFKTQRQKRGPLDDKVAGHDRVIGRRLARQRGEGRHGQKNFAHPFPARFCYR